MSTKHTPGPWHVEKQGGRYEIWPKDKGPAHCYVGVAQTKDDAALFAAAPELLEAFTAIDKLTCNCPLMSLEAQRQFEQNEEAKLYRIELAKVIIEIRGFARDAIAKAGVQS